MRFILNRFKLVKYWTKVVKIGFGAVKEPINSGIIKFFSSVRLYSNAHSNAHSSAGIQPLKHDIVDFFSRCRGDVIGKVKVKKRGLEEFVEVNVRRAEIVDDCYDDVVKYELENDGKPLILVILENAKDKNIRKMNGSLKDEHKNGLLLSLISKSKAGEQFENLARIMDILAVKESKKVGLKGKVFLLSLPNAIPLHWKRGYQSVGYFGSNAIEKRAFNLKMNDKFKEYAHLREEGYNIDGAMETLHHVRNDDYGMTLRDKYVKKYLKDNSITSA